MEYYLVKHGAEVGVVPSGIGAARTEAPIYYSPRVFLQWILSIDLNTILRPQSRVVILAVAISRSLAKVTCTVSVKLELSELMG